jgi:hypothetical protein
MLEKGWFWGVVLMYSFTALSITGGGVAVMVEIKRMHAPAPAKRS